MNKLPELCYGDPRGQCTLRVTSWRALVLNLKLHKMHRNPHWRDSDPPVYSTLHLAQFIHEANFIFYYRFIKSIVKR